MSIFITAAAAVAASQAVAPPAPPAPPVVITPTAPPAPPMGPPPIYISSRPSAGRLAQPPVTLEVRVSGEGGLLWEGSLRVGPMPAMVNQSRSEAQAAGCPADTPAYERSVRTAFMLNISSASGEDPDRYGVTVSWMRVPDGEACARTGNRTVQLQSSIQVPNHGSATLHGDAGLTVQIRRR